MGEITIVEPDADIPDYFNHDPGKARARILQLEVALRSEIAAGNLPENTKTMPLRHEFIPGGYARELTIPKGTLIVGRIHLGPCFNFVTQGEIVVLTEDGVKRVSAPASFVSPPGTKRVGYAVSDTIWTTVHVTDVTDVDTIEAALTVDTYQEYELALGAEKKALPE